MITGELKNKIDGLWDVFAASGIVEPLSVIEQITYLMFIRDLDDADNKRAKESAMLGLPYQSIFTNEVKIGDTMIDGTQLKCILSCRSVYFLLLKHCITIKTVHTQSIWMMRFLNCLLHWSYQK